MSYAGAINLAGGGGGGSAVLSLEGNSGGLVFPTGNNIFILGANGINAVGNPGTSTITVSGVNATTSSVGVASFNPTEFTVTGGEVSLIGGTTAAVQTLSDDVNTLIDPSASGNIQLIGHINEQGSTKFSTVVAGTSIANINPMSSARWIVDPLGFNGTHVSLEAAMLSATSGDTIQVLPGTYTPAGGVLTLKAGVNICGLFTDSELNGGANTASNIVIKGELSFSAAGAVTISGVQLQTNSNYFLSVSGSSASIVNLNGCYLNCLNHTGISYTSSSASSQINISYCSGNTGTTGITPFVSTSLGTLEISYTDWENSGLTTTPSTCNATTLNLEWSLLKFPISMTAAVVSANYTQINSGPTNSTALTLATSGTSFVYSSDFQSGSSSAISIGAGTILNLYASQIFSTNTNAISGSGTLNYGDVIFTGTSNTISTTTQNPVAWPVKQGGTGASTFTAYAPVVGGTTTTGPFQSASTGISTSGFVLTSTGASSLPTFQAPATSGTVTTVSVANANGFAGTVATATTTPVITISTTATGVLSGNGTSISGSAVTQNGVVVGGATNALATTAVGSTGTILQGNTGAAPTYSTATYPSTTTINQVLYSSSANVVTGLATANNGVYITGTTGIPSVLANGTTGQVLTATTGSPPSWVTPSSGGITSVNIQTFTASGTYTPTSGMLYCIIECVGGGGSGGGIGATSSLHVASSGGGAGGNYSRTLASSATIGASQTVTIGAGGAAPSAGANNGNSGGETSVGAICSANGGGGGVAGSTTTGTLIAAGGAPGANTGGTINIQGSPGGYSLNGQTSTAAFAVQGSGGGTAISPQNTAAGVGGGGTTLIAGIAGVANSGQGGTGSCAQGSESASAGGAGGSGIVIITEYI